MNNYMLCWLMKEKQSENEIARVELIVIVHD